MTHIEQCLSQVVLLNQVTTKFIEGSFQLTLALGNCFGSPIEFSHVLLPYLLSLFDRGPIIET